MQTIDKDSLAHVVAEIFVRAGVSREIAALVADNLVEANLVGHDSHGVGMVERYVESIQSGGLLPQADATPVINTNGLTVFDGNRGFGQLVGRTAMDHLASQAKATGFASVGLRNAHHLGRIGAFSEQLADQGLVSIIFVNVRSANVVAPWGGREGRFGTNPVCIGVPRSRAPHFILDFATSMIAMGKVRIAYLNQQELAQQAVIDAAGNACTDPRPMYEEPQGALLPFGEHKGSGLAFACSLLTGIMIGGETDRNPPEFDRSIINGLFAVAVDPRASGAAEGWRVQVDEYIEWVLSAARRDPGKAIQAPGEPEYGKLLTRSRDGIDIDGGTLESLVRAAARVGMEAEFVHGAFQACAPKRPRSP